MVFVLLWNLRELFSGYIYTLSLNGRQLTQYTKTSKDGVMLGHTHNRLLPNPTPLNDNCNACQATSSNTELINTNWCCFLVIVNSTSWQRIRLCLTHINAIATCLQLEVGQCCVYDWFNGIQSEMLISSILLHLSLLLIWWAVIRNFGVRLVGFVSGFGFRGCSTWVLVDLSNFNFPVKM